MRHHEEGKQCATNTPRAEARQPGRRRKQRYPEGGTSKTWTKAPTRTIRGGGRATAGRDQTNNQKRITNRGTTPTVALHIASTMGKTMNSRTLASGTGRRGVVSSVLCQGKAKPVTSSPMIVRHRVREHALMQWASWCEEALV